MELGEVRRATFNLSGAVGVNSISSFTVSSPNLTFGTPSISGTSASVTMTAAAVGVHQVKATAVLSSAETVIGYVRVKVLDTSQETGGSDYDR